MSSVPVPVPRTTVPMPAATVAVDPPAAEAMADIARLTRSKEPNAH